MAHIWARNRAISKPLRIPGMRKGLEMARFRQVTAETNERHIFFL